ncbi:MAG: class II fructose-bisphosphate aldolase [Holosporales bacterium]|jgi:fructose-bisphosphate aldolase class II|nr:class II fructose-bisphosphate aldolase [Holosporales bacterium]
MFVDKKLVPGSELLSYALSNKIAIGAFNFANTEVVQAIVSAANVLKTPIILQASPSAIAYLGTQYLKAIVSVAAEESEGPLALHLDHGQDFEICKRCIDEGFSSVMIDSSSLSFEENVRKTKAVVDYAKKFGVSVEAELGTLSGVEDGTSVLPGCSFYTNPDEALEFIERTGIDSLAVAVGTSHGSSKGKNGNAKISIERLREIRKKVGNFPLVLHGASSVYQDFVDVCNKYGANLKDTCGISDNDIREAIQNGVAKVNVDTDIRIAFLSAVRKVLSENTSLIDMRGYLSAAKDAAKEVVMRKIKTFL